MSRLSFSELNFDIALDEIAFSFVFEELLHLFNWVSMQVGLKKFLISTFQALSRREQADDNLYLNFRWFTNIRNETAFNEVKIENDCSLLFNYSPQNSIYDVFNGSILFRHHRII